MKRMNRFEEAVANSKSGVLKDAKIQGGFVICLMCGTSNDLLTAPAHANGLQLNCRLCGTSLIEPEAHHHA
jgi:hypothetical protein